MIFPNLCHDGNVVLTEEFLSRGMAGIYEYHRTQMFPAHYQNCSIKDGKIRILSLKMQNAFINDAKVINTTIRKDLQPG